MASHYIFLIFAILHQNADTLRQFFIYIISSDTQKTTIIKELGNYMFTERCLRRRCESKSIIMFHLSVEILE